MARDSAFMQSDADRLVDAIAVQADEYGDAERRAWFLGLVQNELATLKVEAEREAERDAEKGGRAA